MPEERDNVIQLEAYRGKEHPAQEGSYNTTLLAADSALALLDVPTPAASAHITIDDLYPQQVKNRDCRLGSALHLLSQALDLLCEARSELLAGNDIYADDAMQRLLVLLPELFCYRSLGDGFGAITNSVYFAIRNKSGALFSSEELTALHSILTFLRSRPYISFNTALTEIMRLEDTGLEVDPKELAPLSELGNA